MQKIINQCTTPDGRVHERKGTRPFTHAVVTKTSVLAFAGSRELAMKAAGSHSRWHDDVTVVPVTQVEKTGIKRVTFVAEAAGWGKESKSRRADEPAYTHVLWTAAVYAQWTGQEEKTHIHGAQWFTSEAEARAAEHKYQLESAERMEEDKPLAWSKADARGWRTTRVHYTLVVPVRRVGKA